MFQCCQSSLYYFKRESLTKGLTFEVKGGGGGGFHQSPNMKSKKNILQNQFTKPQSATLKMNSSNASIFLKILNNFFVRPRMRFMFPSQNALPVLK